jgi:ABC-type phosphate transport system permease subunit
MSDARFLFYPTHSRRAAQLSTMTYILGTLLLIMVMHVIFVTLSIVKTFYHLGYRLSQTLKPGICIIILQI